MAGIKGNKKHANKTSYPNQKMNRKEPAVILRKLKEILNNAINDPDITSWQGACNSIGWRVTKMDYWCAKTPIFGTYKKEVKQILISKIDTKALNGDAVPAPAIWRLKMLGESETIKTDITTNGKELKQDSNETQVVFVNAKKKK